jgi:uncharacterized protein (DUF1499 family)
MNKSDQIPDNAEEKTSATEVTIPAVTGSDMSSKQTTSKRTKPHRILRRFAIILLITIAGLFFLSMTAPQPTNLGVSNGMLAKCPSSPNCVSTQADNPDQKMPAISFDCDPNEMLVRIKDTIKSKFPRARLVSEFDYYLHFEFKSLIFRFVDDVEFFVDDKASVVHFRSASRVGHSDLGANRKRMRQISESLNQ